MYDNVTIEHVHLKYCKYILGVHRLATNNAIRGELGRFPLLLEAICSLVSFWHRLTELDPSTSLVAERLSDLKEQNIPTNWIGSIQTILEKLDLGHVWESPSSLSGNKLKAFDTRCSASVLQMY